MNKWEAYEQELQATQSALTRFQQPSLALRHNSVWHTRADVQKQVQKLKNTQDGLNVTKQKLKEKLAELRQEDEGNALGTIATAVGLGILGLMATKKRK